MNQNDVREAIEIYKDNIWHMEQNPDAFESDLPRFKLVLQALEKQIPKEAVKKQIFEGERAEKLQSKGIRNFETFKCPECNHIVSNRGFTEITVKKFCDNCGQALKEVD
jgi:hypothetical protein